MSEIAKCPICGEPPMELVAAFGKSFVAICCCGAEFRKKELWNQYAAAMALAKAVVKANEPYSIAESPIKPDCNQAVFGRRVTREINNAEQRVLEVFK